MTDDERKRLQSLGRFLKANVPLEYLAYIRRVAMPAAPGKAPDIGDCLLVNRRFRIRWNEVLDYNLAKGTLIHEFAHALSWGMDMDQDDHGEMFWESRSIVFAVYVAWLRSNG